MTGKPNISIWIAPATQEVKTDFMPQALKPAEYGVVFAVAITHIARAFLVGHPEVQEQEVIDELLRGIATALPQVPPPTPMVSH